jgi:hypothetical protein
MATIATTAKSSAAQSPISLREAYIPSVYEADFPCAPDINNTRAKIESETEKSVAQAIRFYLVLYYFLRRQMVSDNSIS